MTKENFKQLYDEYFDAIRRYLYYRSNDSELATDIAQEVFMKAWEKQISYEPNRTKSLLYKMAGDMFVSQVRKNKVADKYRDTINLEFNLDQGPDEKLEYEELKQHYERTLAGLSEKQRTVFLMSRLEEMTYNEIAQRLELSVKAVEKRMGLALTELRKAIKI
jgi:RNA polymerase sigma-70 factor (ECF subfamily)